MRYAFPPYACSPLQLLPVRRRKAMYALYAFCCEVHDIADGEASRSLRQTLLLNWRSEIARLLAGRPQDKRRCKPMFTRLTGSVQGSRSLGAKGGPVQERPEHRAKCLPNVGEAIFDLWRNLRMHLTPEDLVSFELSKLLNQHLLRDAGG